MLFPEQITPEEQARRRGMRASRSTIAEVRRIHLRQIAEVEALSRETMAAIAPVLERAEQELARDLREWIHTRADADVRFTPFSYRNSLAQIIRIRARLEERLGGALERDALKAQHMALRHLTEEVARFSELFEGSVRRISLNVTAQIATGRSFIIPRIRTSAARYAGNVGTDIQQHLSIAILRGEGVSATVDRLQAHAGPRGLVALRGVAGEPGAIVEEIPEGLFRRYRYWAERVVRTETESAYNTQLMVGMREASRTIPGMQKRWNADGRACLKICVPIDGQVQPLEHPFETSVGPVDQAPAHPNCRCRTGAWRDEWSHAIPPTPPPSPPGGGPAPPAATPAPPPPAPVPVAPPPPRHGFDARALHSALRAPLGPQDRRGLRLLPTVEGREVRNILRSFVGRTGMVNRETGLIGAHEFGVKSQARMGGALASHNTSSGLITAVPDIRGEAVAFLARVNAGTTAAATESEALGMEALVHEAVHGHAPMVHEAYVGVGMLVEEATTEAAARRLMRDAFGLTQTAVQNPLGAPNSTRPYDRFIVGLRRAVEIGAGLAPAEAMAAVEEASFEMRRYSGPVFTTDAEYVRHFVRSLPIAGDVEGGGDFERRDVLTEISRLASQR